MNAFPACITPGVELPEIQLQSDGMISIPPFSSLLSHVLSTNRNNYLSTFFSIAHQQFYWVFSERKNETISRTAPILDFRTWLRENEEPIAEKGRKKISTLQRSSNPIISFYLASEFQSKTNLHNEECWEQCGRVWKASSISKLQKNNSHS